VGIKISFQDQEIYQLNKVKKITPSSASVIDFESEFLARDA
jgi:hypothetical protein